MGYQFKLTLLRETTYINVKKNLIYVELLRNMLTITPINENFQNLNPI